MHQVTLPPDARARIEMWLRSCTLEARSESEAETGSGES